MRLVAAPAGCPQAVLHLVAKFCCCATFASAQGYCHSLHLGPGFQCVGMVSLNADAIRAAQRVGSQCPSLDSKRHSSRIDRPKRRTQVLCAGVLGRR